MGKGPMWREAGAHSTAVVSAKPRLGHRGLEGANARGRSQGLAHLPQETLLITKWRPARRRNCPGLQRLGASPRKPSQDGVPTLGRWCRTDGSDPDQLTVTAETPARSEGVRVCVSFLLREHQLMAGALTTVPSHD